MTHPQQTTREVLKQAYARALKLHNDHWMHWSDDDIANSNENLSMFRAMLGHPTHSTTSEATFLPPALHEGAMEHTAGDFTVKVSGLTIRQIKEIFEDKYHGSMMWSNGAAYPTDGVSIKFASYAPNKSCKLGLTSCAVCQNGCVGDAIDLTDGPAATPPQVEPAPSLTVPHDGRGFYAKVTMRHESLMPGKILFMKVAKRHHGAPSLYSIVDPRTGFATGDAVDGNTFKNQFVVVPAPSTEDTREYCDYCGGDGDLRDGTPCPFCDGSGRVDEPAPSQNPLSSNPTDKHSELASISSELATSTPIPPGIYYVSPSGKFIPHQCPAPNTFNSGDFEGAETMPAPSTAGEREEVIEALNRACRGGLDCTCTLHRAAALLQSTALPVGELTDQSNLATIAGLEVSTGHLSAMVDELRALLGRALDNFTTLHNAAKPDEDGPDIDAIIHGGVFAAFVDEDAAIRYALNQTCHAEAIAAARSQPVREPLTEAEIKEMLSAKHFDPSYKMKASDIVCSSWYKMGVQDAESRHGITKKGAA